MKTATQRSRARVRLEPDEIRAALIEMGLREEEKPIPGYAFTYWKEPHNAVAFWQTQHGGAEPTRFYMDRRTYILSA